MENKKDINTDYPLIPMLDIEDEARQIAVRWAEGNGFDWIGDKHKLASDIMNYARKYCEKENQDLKEEISILKSNWMDYVEKASRDEGER